MSTPTEDAASAAGRHLDQCKALAGDMTEAQCRQHLLDGMVAEAGEHNLYADTAVPRPTR